MHGRGSALLLAVVLTSPLLAQSGGGAKPSPSSFLLAPVSSEVAPIPANSSSRSAASDLPDDAPTPKSTPAAKLAPPRDVTPVSHDTVQEATKTKAATEPKPQKPLSGEELFSYLSESQKPNSSTYTRTSSDIGDSFNETINDTVGPEARKGWFKSDHSFDCFVSPVTNPFLFEDPRTLTEIRPIVIYQKIPGAQPNFKGGSMWFYGGQARMAFGNKFSITINKLGGMTVSPDDPTYPSGSGLAELWLGPKFTFIRNEETGMLLAAGGIFQIPLGGSNVYQNTGNLSIAPYISYGKNFMRTNSGSFNGLAAAGYSFSTNSARSNYFYMSGHLDFDVANSHRFYPLIEMNWMQYTRSGSFRYISGEGRDMINFGGLTNDGSLVTMAFGARFKLTRNTELGGAFEFPLFGNRDYFQNRFTMDFIWRY